MATPRGPQSVDLRGKTTTRGSVSGSSRRRQREREAVVLAQIVARASRLRGSSLDAPALTLVELLQASSAVLDKHGIRAPEDALYHRHLLALSLDPERDWKRKIQRFVLNHGEPRASRAGGDGVSTTPFSPHASSVGSVAKAAPRRTSTAANGSQTGQPTPVRRRSGVGAEWIPPGVASRPPSRQGKRPSTDQFGDMLVASAGARLTARKESTLKENQVRSAATADASTATDGEIAKVTPAQKLQGLAAIRARLLAISGELTVDGEDEEADDENGDDDDERREEDDGTSSYASRNITVQDDDDDAYSESISASVRSIPPHAYYPSPVKAPSTIEDGSEYFDSTCQTESSPIEVVGESIHQRFEADTFRRLATSFQEWKELTTFHRLVRDSQQRELRLTQSVLPPVATFAIFRWIIMTLPARRELQHTQITLVVPSCVGSRGIAASNPPLLRHFTGRLLVWTVHRIFKTWAESARAIQTLRIKSLIRLRTQVFRTAFECLQHWHQFAKRRRRTNDQGMWVEALQVRRTLRRTMRVWQSELKTRSREHEMTDVYRRRHLRVILKRWHTWTRQCRLARDRGSKQRLRRHLRAWRRSIIWSEQEYAQTLLARAQYTRRVFIRCWSGWRHEASFLKMKRLQKLKATRYFYAKAVRRVVQAWRDDHRTRKHLAQKCARLKKRKQLHILRAILVGWSSYANQKKYCLLTVMDASARRDGRLLQRVMRAWISHVALQSDADKQRVNTWRDHKKRQVWIIWKRKTSLLRLSTTVRSLFNSSTMQTAFARWRSWVQKQKYYRLLIGDWRGEQDGALKQRVFNAFRQNVNFGRVKAHAVQGFLNRCVDTRLQSYILAWRDFIRSQRTTRRHDELRTEKCRQMELRHCWATWRQAFHVAHCVHVADVTMAQSAQRRHFHLWVKAVRTRHALRVSTSQFRGYHLKCAVRKWSHRVSVYRKDRYLIKTLGEKSNAFVLERGWRIWRNAFAIAKQRHIRAASAILQWQNKRVELFFIEWKAVYTRRKQLKALLGTWQEGLKGKSLSSFWRGWRDYIALKYEKRALLAEALRHYERRSLRLVIKRLRVRCELSQEKLLVIQKCVSHWGSNTRQRLFTQWKRFSQLRRHLQAAGSRNRSKIVQRYFMKWCKWKHCKDLAALKVFGLASQLSEWMMRRAVRRLRQYTATSKRLASLQGLIKLAGSRGLQTAAFRRWVQFAATRKSLKRQDEARRIELQRFRQLQFVKRWDKWTRLKKLLASTLTQTKERKTRAMTARIFARWRQHVAERKLFVALKEKASVFQALSLLPTYFFAWCRYVEVQKRNQLLVLKASQLVCHQRESRAFRSWILFVNRAKQARAAIRVWRNQSMQNRFARWRAFVAQQRATHRAISFYRSITRRHIIREWHQEAHRQRLLAHFTQIWHAQTTEQCFRQWARYVKTTKCARVLLRRLQQTSLTRVFNSWRVFIAKHQEIVAGVHRRFTLLWNQDRTMMSFQRWKALTKREKLLKRRMLQRLTKQTGTFFNHWRSVVVRRKLIKERGVTLHERTKRFLLITSWALWKRSKGTHDAVNAFRRRVMGQSSDTLVRVLLQEWKKITMKALKAKRAHGQKNRNYLVHTFSFWKERFVFRRKQERGIAAEVSKRRDLRIVKGVMLRMRARMTIKNACTRVFLPQLQRHVIAETWRSWVRYHIRKQETKKQIQGVLLSAAKSDEAVKHTALVCLSRWRALQLARCLGHWCTVSRHLKWMRNHTAKAIRQWETSLCASSFRSWRSWASIHRRKQVVKTGCRKHRQARAWSLWQRFHQDQQIQNVMRKQAQRFHRRHVLVAITAAWRRVLARRRHHSLLEASLTLYRTQRSLRKWHAFAIHTRSHRIQITVATAAAQQKCFSSCWSQWRQFIHDVKTHRRELQQHTERLQVLILCSTFRAWCAWSTRKGKMSRVLAFLSRRCDVKTARRILHNWARYAKTTKLQQAMTTRFARETSMRKGIQGLLYHAQERMANREVTQKAREWVEILQGRYVRRCFQSWQRLIRLTKKVRQVIQHYNTSKLLPNALNAWKAYILLRNSKNSQLERAVCCWRSVFARRAWNAWLDYHSKKKGKQIAWIKARNHSTVRVLRVALLGWRSTTRKKRAMSEGCRKMLVQWKMQTVYRCFVSWQTHTLRRKTICVSAAIVSSRIACAQLREAWGEWRRQFVVNRVGLRKRLARAFDQWLQWRYRRRGWLQFQMLQSQAFLLNVRGRQGIKQWRHFVVQAKMAKTMALLSSRFSKDTLVKRCFEKWLQYLVTRHHDKEKMKRVVVWIRNRQLMSCFLALVQYTRDKQRKKEADKTATSHARLHTVRNMFTAWKKIVSVIREQRLQLRRYVDVMQHVSQRRSFIAWRNYTWRRIQLKTTCASLLSQRTQLTTRALFDDWVIFTIEKKRREMAKTFNYRRLYKETLRQWAKFLVLARIERMLGASEQRIIERCFVGWRKRAAIHVTVRRLGREKRERERKDILKSHLVAWSSWTRVQTKCSSLLANVALGHTLRFRFLLWKKYTEKSRKLRQLVIGSGSVLALAHPSTDGAVHIVNGSAVRPSEQHGALRLARMAGFFQQFQVDWSDKASVWQRWRHAFHACLFYRMRRLHKIFSGWQSWSRRRCHVRALCSLRQQTRQYLLQKTVLLQWREVVSTVKMIQRERQRERELLVIVNAQMLRQDRKVLQRHWTAWRERTENKRHLLTSVDSYQRARVLTKFWLLWSHDFVNIMRHQHRLQAQRCSQLAAMKAKRMIQYMREQSIDGKRARYVIKTLQDNRHSRWLRQTFDGWKRRADKSRRARLLVVFKKRQMLRLAYQAWCLWLEARHQQANAVDDFVNRRTRRTRANTFGLWRTYLLQRRQRADAIALATSHYLQRRLHTRWLRTVQIRKLARQRIEQPREALERWRQRRALTRWHNTAHRDRLLRNLKVFVMRKHLALWKLHVQEIVADRFCLRLLKTRMGKAFQLWRSQAARRCQLRGIEFQLCDLRAERNARRVWNEWLLYVDRKRNARSARDHFSHVLQLKSLLHWYDATKESIRARADQLTVADEFRVFSSKRAVLRKWVTELVHARQRHAVLLVCVFKIQRAFTQRLQQSILHAWYDAADLQRFSRECACIMEQRRQARAIRRWRRQIHDRRRMEQLKQDAVVYRSSRLLSQVFFHWQNYALAWKDAEAVRQHKPTRQPPAISAPPPPPPPPPMDTNPGEASEDEEDDSTRFRRPLSPMKKRLWAKNAGNPHDPTSDTAPPVPSIADAATLSLDVKKRLLVLGKWKPTHKSLSHV